MNDYLKLLDNMNSLTLSQKRILLGITTYLTENELNELDSYRKSIGISAKESLLLKDLNTENKKINETFKMFSRYI